MSMTTFRLTIDTLRVFAEEMDKATAETASIPILALTAHAMQRDRDRALAAGCDGYLSKPYKSQHLSDEIVRVLRTARSRPATDDAPGAA